MQPFEMDGDICVCNGEIYCFRPIKEKLKAKYTFKSDSDCEIILPLYREMGLKMFEQLDSLELRSLSRQLLCRQDLLKSLRQELF